MIYDIDNYEEAQLKIYNQGLQDKASIADLNPLVHDADKMDAIQTIRTNENDLYSSIEDLDFTQHSSSSLLHIAIDRREADRTLSKADKELHAIDEAKRFLAEQEFDRKVRAEYLAEQEFDRQIEADLQQQRK